MRLIVNGIGYCSSLIKQVVLPLIFWFDSGCTNTKIIRIKNDELNATHCKIKFDHSPTL